MSFNFSPIGNNGLPAMLPLLTNIANGNNFLPSLANSQVNAAGLLTNHQSVTATSLSGTGLEFTQTPPKLKNPLDVDERDPPYYLPPSTVQNNELNLAAASSIRKIGVEPRRLDELQVVNGDDSAEKTFQQNAVAQTIGAFNHDLMYNNMLGMPSQSLMMMPNVMNMLRGNVDPSAMLQSLQPQFSLFNHLSSINQTATITTTTPVSLPETNVTPTSSTPSMAATCPSVATKETITCNSCILLPPNPNAPAPTTRERPQGCRTVFVGGLPENMTEDIIREVFERCGEITTLRLSKKNFCHIRFAFEASVDSAIYLSGYRIRINNQSDSANCGRLHVDFAQARDDQYEFECKQRQLHREQRHRERIERDRLRPLSPPPVVHFSEHEASSVSERLKQEDTFSKAIAILITWLERGDCSKKNATLFYSMVQSTNSHVRRLLNEKATYEEELNKAKEMHRKQMHSLSTQLSQIEKVFGAASHKKVWDHFTKAQRKNIDLWKKQSLDVQVPSESYDISHDADEMEMSDDEAPAAYGMRYGKRTRSEMENENQKSESMASSTVGTTVKDQQLKVLQETIRNLQTQLLENKTKEKENLSKIVDLEDKLKRANVKELLLKTKIVEVSKCSSTSQSARDSESNDSDKDVVCVDDDIDRCLAKVEEADSKADSKMPSNSDSTTVPLIDMDEARIIGLVSSFLVVHPFGAELNAILAYVEQAPSITLSANDLELILQRYNSLFYCDNNKWKFGAFNSQLNSNQN